MLKGIQLIVYYFYERRYFKQFKIAGEQNFERRIFNLAEKGIKIFNVWKLKLTKF